MAALLFKRAELITGSGISVSRQAKRAGKGFEIIASKYGVSFLDTSAMFETHADLQSFARALGDSWNDVNELRRTGKPYYGEKRDDSDGRDPGGGDPAVAP